MLMRKSDLTALDNPNMRGGNGTVHMHRCEAEPMPTHARLLSEIVLDPGCSIGSHRHEGELEIFYFLEGEITLDDNGTERMAHAGDVSICYDGEVHGIANLSQSAARLFAVIITNA